MTTKVPNFSSDGFGEAAEDYEKHRPGFPPSFFEKIGYPGEHLLDLGTGTGTLARGFARLGCKSVGIDPDTRMLESARLLAAAENLDITFKQGKAEQLPFEQARFDVVTAGMCWHWFEGAIAAAECFRVLATGGKIIIPMFCYLPMESSVAKRTEDLLLKYNPSWPLAGTEGRSRSSVRDLEVAGFEDVLEDEFDEMITFSPEGWRGRIRACNGVLALGSEDKIQQFDRALASLLEEEFPARPLRIAHRVFWIHAHKPGG
jgi:ubiquinone/menaquinone biosynthesis C-methylase UbiE